MTRQARRDVMRVLPGRQQHDYRCIRIDALEQIAALALTADETMALVGLDRMGTAERHAELRAQHLVQLAFEFLLDRPACHVG